LDFEDGLFDTWFVYIQVLIGFGCLVSSRFGASGFGFGLRGFGLRASGFGLRGFGASGLHGFGTEVDSCVYAGNGVGDIGYMIFNFPFAIILITHTGERGGSETFRD
jgi:hypothetical protein